LTGQDNQVTYARTYATGTFSNGWGKALNC